ncbi:hypothetical protein [Qipengyuania pacifica]|uniref:hypothetical protein n=1 Tax=Qipengyuania pacifica TaxID=2860199 RepID=UPI001C9DF1C9|nr:hypothetical protein [Qipengyuania pacifica]MBY8335210.1 hypothetical protein [Qipengyuania pacifica]
MAIVPYPSPNRHLSVDLQPVVASQANRAELTGARQAVDLGYSWWVGEVTVVPMIIDHARAFRVFFGRVRGVTHSFRVPVATADQHTGTFTVRAQGAGSGYSLVTDGWPANSTPLLAGQYVTVGDQLMVLDEDVIANASGVATLRFHSPLRRVVADNTLVQTKRPWLLAYLPEGAPVLKLTAAQLQSGFSFPIMEAY